MALLQIGPIRLAVVNSSGVKQKTLVLPPPSKDGLDLEWIEKSSTVDLIDGSPRTRTLGYVPQLTVKWKTYDERTGQGYTIGTADGNRPTLEQLLGLLVNGLTRISPGLSAGGFTADRIQVKGIGKQSDFYTGVQVTFIGRAVLSSRTLEVF